MNHISAQWYDDEQSIIILEYRPGYTWDDYHIAGETLQQMRQSVSHPVFVVNSYQAGTRLPKDSALPHLRFSQRKRPQQPSFIVTQSAVTRHELEMLAKVLGKEIGQDTLFFDTVADAIAAIRTHQARVKEQQ